MGWHRPSRLHGRHMMQHVYMHAAAVRADPARNAVDPAFNGLCQSKAGAWGCAQLGARSEGGAPGSCRQDVARAGRAVSQAAMAARPQCASFTSCSLMASLQPACMPSRLR